MNPQFLRKSGDISAALQPLHRLFAQGPRVFLPWSLFCGHFAVSSLQSVASGCLRLGVQCRSVSLRMANVKRPMSKEPPLGRPYRGALNSRLRRALRSSEQHVTITVQFEISTFGFPMQD